MPADQPRATPSPEDESADCPGTDKPTPAGLDGAPRARPAGRAGSPSSRTYDFNQSWLFGGAYLNGSEDPEYDDSGFARITLPHTVVPLSWANWDQKSWEKSWIYRKHFNPPQIDGGRIFVDFDGVMVNADIVLNGVKVSSHLGGYLPWSAELTRHLVPGDNTLAVIVHSQQLSVPPEAGPGDSAVIDFLQPGGIYRDVTLRAVPGVFLSEIFARPVRVLAPDRSVEVQATIDAGTVPRDPVRLTAELLDGSRVLASAQTAITISTEGNIVARLTIADIGEVTLWSPDSPKLYTVRVTLADAPDHAHQIHVRTGFREAVFQPDGFYLNGQRLQIAGLNRHQFFPYIGMAAAARLQRRDARILKLELNCNMVRCSHYPQSPHFLDACDELGLMVWQEPPGWQHVGDATWQDMAVQNVHDMMIRDRNRPSVILWATRLNETPDHPSLNARARQLASDLDGTRQTTGAMNVYSTAGWAQDVFAYNDYRARDGTAELRPPLPDVPYLVSEAVGAISGAPTYRWIDTGAVLASQARLHARVHNIARSSPRYAGLLGWAGIDYPSRNGGERIWNNMKTPGVIDTFRVPKPGAAFYQSQVDPAIRPVIRPAFFWEFGTSSRNGPGANAMIATNCDRLEVYVRGEHLATATPDTENFGYLAYPPVFVDLTVDGSARPELRIAGYVGPRQVASIRMSADTSRDHLNITAADSSIQADGTDMTQITFRALDAYGNQRRHISGKINLALAGPGVLIGDNPFAFEDYGAVGGAFIRSQPGQVGVVTVTARHPDLGRAAVQVTVTPRDSRRAFL
jgi:beta-galactosidase